MTEGRELVFYMNVYHNNPNSRHRIGNSRLYDTKEEAYSYRVREGNYIDSIPVMVSIQGEYKPLDIHGRVIYNEEQDHS